MGDTRGDLTKQQACELPGVGHTKLDSLIAEGTLESYKLWPDRRSGRRIKRESIERLRNGCVGRQEARYGT